MRIGLIGAAKHKETGDEAGSGRRQHGTDETQDRISPPGLGKQSGGIGTNAEEGSMAK